MRSVSIFLTCWSFLYSVFASVSSDLQNFEVEADDLVSISELGRGAYGVVEKVHHAKSDTIMAVKVRTLAKGLKIFGPSRLHGPTVKGDWTTTGVGLETGRWGILVLP